MTGRGFHGQTGRGFRRYNNLTGPFFYPQTGLFIECPEWNNITSIDVSVGYRYFDCGRLTWHHLQGFAILGKCVVCNPKAYQLPQLTSRSQSVEPARECEYFI